MQLSLLRRLAVLAPVLLSCAVCALACDPFPDECEDDDNVCDGNVANRCDQPGPESRRVTTREDCGPSRACVIDDFGFPVCARPASQCEKENEFSCRDDRTMADCVRTKDGRLVLVDTACFQGGSCVDGRCISK
jgi:hypothetical protein